MIAVEKENTKETAYDLIKGMVNKHLGGLLKDYSRNLQEQEADLLCAEEET